MQREYNYTTASEDFEKHVAQELSEYFSGIRRQFSFLLDAEGTAFQKRVWKALMEIPYGEKKSYKAIAQRIGNEKACRAVGMANKHNPIAIAIPCHRVIGADGNLTGYAGGLDIKAYLLALEMKTCEKE